MEELNTYWYILRVMPGKERQITDNFNERISVGNIGFIKRFICPIEKELLLIRKKKVLRDKVIYSGYIYFETENKLTDDELKIIAAHENVMSMYKGNKLPVLMRKDDVNRIIKDNELTERVKFQVEGVKCGDKVQIIDGPFKDFNGIVKSIINEKITLEITVFGRSTTVILTNNQIKKY